MNASAPGMSIGDHLGIAPARPQSMPAAGHRDQFMGHLVLANSFAMSADSW